ncbi:2'-5'-oligoadenylate synthase 3-like [Lissotriton helveticus]
MAAIPDLYQCLANDLDKYIYDHLQPNEAFLTQVKAAVDTICEFLKENVYRGHPSKTKVLKIVKGGSSAKGTALREGSDADLVIFPTSIQSYSHQESKRKEIIQEIQKKLEECQRQKRFEVIFERTKWDNPRVLSFRLRSKKVPEFIDFDVLPAYDALGQLQKGRRRVDAEIYVELIRNWSPSQNFSTSFTELQRDFIVSRPTKVKCLIRLMKHWYKTKLTGKKLPPKYALELLSIYAWQEGSDRQQRFNMAQTFRNVLELICNYKNLCVYWTENYNLEDNRELAKFIRGQLAKPRPVILDPADPTGNFGEGYNWEAVAREAEKCLCQMKYKTCAGQTLLWDLAPTLPETLIRINPRRPEAVEESSGCTIQ